MVRRANLSLIVCVSMATVGSALAPAPVYRERRIDPSALMQGTWIIQLNINNFAARHGLHPIQVQSEQRIRIQGRTWAEIETINGVETEGTTYQILLDPRAIPATIDLERTVQKRLGGLRAGETAGADRIAMKGIVKVEGDTMTFCYVYGSNQSAARPTGFVLDSSRMPGRETMTMTLKKGK